VNLDEAYQLLGDGPHPEWDALRASNLEFQEMLAAVTSSHQAGAVADVLKQKWGLSDQQASDIKDALVLVAIGGPAALAGANALKKALSGQKTSAVASSEGAKATVSKNPNATSALTDSEAGTLVERNVLETSPKVINQAEPEVLAKVNNGRSPYSELNGAIGEARGWSQAIESGQTPISGPGKASLPGADYITYDPSSRSVIVWDAKYRAPGGSYPTSLPDSKLQAWQSEIINSVKNMPEGSAKAAAESALKAGRVEGRIFKWPQ